MALTATPVQPVCSIYGATSQHYDDVLKLCVADACDVVQPAGQLVRFGAHNEACATPCPAGGDCSTAAGGGGTFECKAGVCQVVGACAAVRRLCTLRMRGPH
jgi:hypothetical protein